MGCHLILNEKVTGTGLTQIKKLHHGYKNFSNQALSNINLGFEESELSKTASTRATMVRVSLTLAKQLRTNFVGKALR
jgi:hypothetical protein